jgi:predicted DsbA family dithiol-disulfide isomerase
MSFEEPLRIDIVSDFSCPWCYIGKRRIASAIEVWHASNPDAAAPIVRWLPYQLHPEVPGGGTSRREYQQQKAGPEGPDPRKHEHIAALAWKLGLHLAFEKIAVQPNTTLAHRLTVLAVREGRQDEVVEGLFSAFFVEGRNISDSATLADIGEAAGLERAQVAAYLESDEDAHVVSRLDFEARVAGIDTVPFFVFNRKVGVPGAHEVKVLVEAMEQAAGADALAAGVE